jgi:hypothetical protein
MGGLYWLYGVWGIAMVGVFIQAIRLSYRVEARSPQLKNTSGLPRNALWLNVVANSGVARDEETQALRRSMNLLLLVNVVGFVLLGAWLWLTRQEG